MFRSASRRVTAAQLHAEVDAARLWTGAEAPQPNTSVAVSRRLQNCICADANLPGGSRRATELVGARLPRNLACSR